MTPTLVDLLLLLTSLGLRDGSALDLAADVRAVVASEPPLLDDRATTARLLAVWAYHESAGRNVLGDHGAACGVLQLHALARQGVPCAEILADRRVGLRLGLAWMRRMAEQCGSVPAGLRAYASGTCAGTPRARRLVESRMREALQ